MSAQELGGACQVAAPVCVSAGQISDGTRRVERGPFAGVSYQSTEEQASMAIASINPATGEVVKNYESLTGTQIEQKLQVAASAFAKHRRTPFAERASKMMRAAEILELEKD